MPPRTTELLLTTLVPDDANANAILGDMAEEWAERAEVDVAWANRWYRWQALRTAPHLLRLWWSRSRARSRASFLLTAAMLRILLAAAGYAGIGGVAAVDRVAGMPDWWTPIASCAALALAGVGIGGLAARLRRQEPLQLVATIAAFTMTINVVANELLSIAGLSTNVYYYLGMAVLTPSGLFFGAIIEVERRAERDEVAAAH